MEWGRSKVVGPHTHVNAGEEEDALEEINDSTRPTLPRMHTRAQSTAWDRLGQVKEKVKITGDVGATSSLASLSVPSRVHTLGSHSPSRREIHVRAHLRAFAMFGRESTPLPTPADSISTTDQSS